MSSVLCAFLLIWGLAEEAAVATPATAANPLVVNVTGQQWVWTFSYPGQGDIESDQLYLPLDRPVVFHVTSKDVIHSFWVVQMGIKVDANPGEIHRNERRSRTGLASSTSGAPSCAGCCTRTWRPPLTS